MIFAIVGYFFMFVSVYSMGWWAARLAVSRKVLGPWSAFIRTTRMAHYA